MPVREGFDVFVVRRSLRSCFEQGVSDKRYDKETDEVHGTNFF
jgi:hypothetical protein